MSKILMSALSFLIPTYKRVLFTIIILFLYIVIFFCWKNDRESLVKAKLHIQSLEKHTENYQSKIYEISRLDEKHTRALSNAKNEIDDLRLRIAAGDERLRIAATCPAPALSQSSTSSMDDATTPRLTKDAEQDYLLLRQQIIHSRKMIEGLQDYIRLQCN